MLIDLNIPGHLVSATSEVPFRLDIQDIIADIPPPPLMAALHLQVCLVKYLGAIPNDMTGHMTFKVRKGDILSISITNPSMSIEDLASQIIKSCPSKNTHIFGAVYDHYYHEVHSFFFRDQLNGYMKDILAQHIIRGPLYHEFRKFTMEAIERETKALPGLQDWVSKFILDVITKEIAKREREVLTNRVIASALGFLLHTDGSEAQNEELEQYLCIEDTPFKTGFFGTTLTSETKELLATKSISIEIKEFEE